MGVAIPSLIGGIIGAKIAVITLVVSAIFAVAGLGLLAAGGAGAGLLVLGGTLAASSLTILILCVTIAAGGAGLGFLGAKIGGFDKNN